MLYTPEYIELNRQQHSIGNYGVSGQHWAVTVNDLANKFEVRSILDYGCGQGGLAEALRQLNPVYAIHEYDPAIAGKEEKPLHADLVVCNDVLEHVEPECLYAVLDDLRNLARVAVFLVVGTAPAKKYLADGRNCHLIQESADYWLPKIMSRWNLWSFQATKGRFVVIGTKR